MTHDHYRLAMFQPDPFLDWTVPIGVLAEVDGEPVVLMSDFIPGADCLGGAGRAAALRAVRQKLRQVRSVDSAVNVIGPTLVLSPERAVPQDCDARAWLEALVSRQRPSEHAVEREAHKRAPPRRVLGNAFFKTHHVDKIVRTTFRPSADVQGWLPPALPELSHWVPGARKVMLMEPICPTRETFETDVAEVRVRFGAYRDALDRLSRNKALQGILVSYILRGGTPDQREWAVGTLQDTTVVVDVAERDACTSFVKEIRETHASLDADVPFSK